MSTDQLLLVTEDDTSIATHLERLDERSRWYASRAHADNTVKSYQSDWRHFTAWCKAAGFDPVPAAAKAVRLYVTDMAEAGYAWATIERRMSTLRAAHKAAEADDPTRYFEVEQTLSGIRRELGVKQAQATPLLVEDLVCILQCLDLDEIRDVRDRALLLVGLVGAFRSAELAGVECSHLRPRRYGLLIDLQRSKTNQEGAEEYKTFHRSRRGRLTCPVAALEDWLEMAGIERGPLFRGVDRWGNVSDSGMVPQSVTYVLRARVKAIGLDPSEYSSHSLRAGHVTQKNLEKEPVTRTMQQTGHSSVQTVAGYDRADAEQYDHTAALGL